MRKLFLTIAVCALALIACEFSGTISLFGGKKEKPAVEYKYKFVTEMRDGKFLLNSGIDAGSADAFLSDISENRDYHFVIENFGGSCFDILSIVNRLEELRAMGHTITTETYGYALSAGAFFFIHGDKRIVHKSAILMFHGCGRVAFGGTRKSLRKPEDLKKVELKLLELFDYRMTKRLAEIGMSEEDIKYWMYDEDYNYMSSDEALELGVANMIAPKRKYDSMQ